MKVKEVAVAVAVFMVFGCGGGGGGGAPNFTQLKNNYQNPNGTLTQQNLNDVVAAFGEVLQKMEGIPVAGSPPALSPQAEYCYGDVCCNVSENGGSCDCSENGSFSFKIGSDCKGGKTCTTSYSYGNCSMIEGYTIDGKGYVWIDTSTGEMIFYFSGTVTYDNEEYAVEYSYYVDGQNIWYLVEVDGEYFAVRGYYDPDTGYGDIYIRDSSNEYHCTIVNNEASCEGL